MLYKTSCECCRNAEVEEQIAHLRAELLHKEQENMCVQLQLQQEVLERERAQKKVVHSWLALCYTLGLNPVPFLSILKEVCLTYERPVGIVKDL